MSLVISQGFGEVPAVPVYHSQLDIAVEVDNDVLVEVSIDNDVLVEVEVD